MAENHPKDSFTTEVPVEISAEAEADADGVDGAEPSESPEVESLRAQLDLSQLKSRETMDRLKEAHERMLRAAADLENYKKRALREKEELQKFGNEKLLRDLLPVLDNLDRALAAASEEDPLRAGVMLVRTTFEQVLGRYGVKGFSAEGVPFDPTLHEALMQVATADKPPGTVVVEHARGFMLHDRLVRPALVGVAVAPPAGPDAEKETNE